MAQDKQHQDDADGYYGEDSLDQEEIDLSFLNEEKEGKEDKPKEDTK